MAYRWTPNTEKPQLQMSGNQIFLDDNVSDERVTPAVITEFLTQLKWQAAGQHPDTSEQFWHKKDMGMRPVLDAENEVDLTEGMYFYWYEAMAYEYAKMLSIGLGE